MTETYVKFWSKELDSPEYIGPFDTEERAEMYADAENYRLSLAGIPGDVANYSVVWSMKDIRIRVETYDGLCTIWYERSKLKNACDVISKRVYNQLCGLNIKEVHVSVI